MHELGMQSSSTAAGPASGEGGAWHAAAPFCATHTSPAAQAVLAPPSQSVELSTHSSMPAAQSTGAVAEGVHTSEPSLLGAVLQT